MALRTPITFPIGTERLWLRPLAKDDLEAVHAVFGDARVMEFVPGGARTRQGSRERLAGLIGHQERHGFSKWAVVERATGAVVGDCGVQVLDDGPDVELGFHLAYAVWGRGYATEAARAALDAAFAALDTDRVLAIVEAENGGSVRVLEKLGMRRTGRDRFFGAWFDVYEATAPRPAPACPKH